MAERVEVGTLIAFGWRSATLREIASDFDIAELWAPLQRFYGMDWNKSHVTPRESCLNNLNRLRAAVAELEYNRETSEVDGLFFEYLELLIDDQEKRNQDNGL